MQILSMNNLHNSGACASFFYARFYHIPCPEPNHAALQKTQSGVIVSFFTVPPNAVYGHLALVEHKIVIRAVQDVRGDGEPGGNQAVHSLDVV